MNKDVNKNILKDIMKYKNKILKWRNNNFINYDNIIYFLKLFRNCNKIITSKRL